MPLLGVSDQTLGEQRDWFYLPVLRSCVIRPSYLTSSSTDILFSHSIPIRAAFVLFLGEADTRPPLGLCTQFSFCRGCPSCRSLQSSQPLSSGAAYIQAITLHKGVSPPVPSNFISTLPCFLFFPSLHMWAFDMHLLHCLLSYFVYQYVSFKKEAALFCLLLYLQ